MVHQVICIIIFHLSVVQKANPSPFHVLALKTFHDYRQSLSEVIEYPIQLAGQLYSESQMTHEEWDDIKTITHVTRRHRAEMVLDTVERRIMKKGGKALLDFSCLIQDGSNLQCVADLMLERLGKLVVSVFWKLTSLVLDQQIRHGMKHFTKDLEHNLKYTEKCSCS